MLHDSYKGRELLPNSYNYRELLPDGSNCRELLPDSYNCRELLVDNYNCRELLPDSYNCHDLLSNISKVYKKFMFECGFKNRFSAQHCLLSMSEKWKSAVDNRKTFGALLTDL